MASPIPITFESPLTLCVAAVALAAGAVIALVRRPAVPAATYALAGAGGVLLALAAGGPAWRPAGEPVLVMVDLSPSTRTAQFRDPAALRARISALLGDVPHRIVAFSGAEDATAPLDLADARSPLPDKPAERTVFAPPAAAAVVLFSDGRFAPPEVPPPVYVVVDPLLESLGDAAVERLEPRAGEVSVTTRNGGSPREMTVAGTQGASAVVSVPPGPLVVTRALAEAARPGAVVARLSPGDAWPENDALSLVPPPPPQAERWWVAGQASRSPPDLGWRALRPAELPGEAAAYLAPSVVVLDNVAADQVGAAGLQRLTQFVRNLGGGLVILGGDNAFAAGGYAGTALELLSPLASTPPEPAAHWVVLVDSSGSMNAPAGNAGGGTRWRVAVDAAAALVRALPPNDLASVGGFAADVTWWARGRRAADAASEPFPPPTAGASGPTELRRALDAATAAAEAARPTHVVLLTDANADVPDPDAVAAAMRERTVRLHLLAIGDPSGATPGGRTLGQIVAGTGGTVVEETNPSRWVEAARRLLRGAAPRLLETHPATGTFVGELRDLPAREVSPWNRTWLKPGATVLAEGKSPGGTGLQSDPVSLAARWAAGEGNVAAAAFSSVTPAELDALLRLVARPPRDPRLRVEWDAGGRLRVAVDAGEGGRHLNGLELSLELADPAATGSASAARAVRIPQTAPGRYELAIDSPRSPVIAAVRHGGRAVERVAIAGRYAPEFDAVGNDRRAMRQLAARGGGAVVEPGDAGPLPLRRPGRPVPLTSPLAAIGAACVALGLVRWKMS